MIELRDLWLEAVHQVAAANELETRRRLAITALYYATFHIAGRVVGVDTSKPGEVHEKVFRALLERNEKAAGRFNSLRTARVRAHYKLREDVPRYELQTVQNHATAVLTLLGVCVPVAPEPDGQKVEPASGAPESRGKA